MFNSMTSLFGKAQASKTQPKDAIVKLRENIEMLDKREKYLETKVIAEISIARANATKNKKVALMALKRKKLYEDQINKNQGSRLMLEQQVMVIENANVNKETMEAMRIGAEGLKNIHGAMDINKVDEIKDSIGEQMDLANEISEAISQPIIFGQEIDEDELDAELELLQQEEADEKYLAADGMHHAPSVPTNVIPAIAQPPRPIRVQQSVEDEEDAELAELKASMALARTETEEENVSNLKNGDESLKKIEKKLKKEEKKKRKLLQEETVTSNIDTNALKSHKKSKKSKKEKVEEDKVDKSEVDTVKNKTTLKDRTLEENLKRKEKTISDNCDEWNYVENPSLTTLSQAEVDSYLKKHTIELIDEHQSPKRPVMSFNLINFPSEIQKIFDKLKFENPTPIQAASWPSVLSGRDLVGIAATGSGKTFAFGIPALIKILNKKIKQKVKNQKAVIKAAPIVLILSPTRELAIQIQQTLENFTKVLKINSVCIYGGVPKWEQKKLLLENGGADVVVATPGRLLDLLGFSFGSDELSGNEISMDVQNVEMFILDEADRMLDMGFEKDIKRIANGITNKNKQTVMFSATWPKEIQSLALTYMKSPLRITIGTTNLLTANTSITQHVTVLDPMAKEKKLLELLNLYHSSRKNRVLIFVLYKKEAVRVEQFLKRNRWNNVKSIHGDLNQQQRLDGLESFRDGTTPLLIATDVAARGLDIPNVEYVINYTYPLTTEEYCHRIGRTGRAGKSGISHTLFTLHDKSHSGALINVLKGASQVVPDSLFAFGTTVKKKLDPNYGAFAKDVDMTKKGTKVVFGNDSDEE
ncbi:RNA-dependent ATPase [Lobulomyces angularis]|nr:RNA-dependent ATPase [Lobulomyces angularis]